MTIRFTEELFNTLTADADAAGLPRTEYIRQLIMNHKPVISKRQIASTLTFLAGCFTATYI